MRKIAIIGAGGFGREVKMLIDQINHIEKKYEFIGFYDDNIPIDSEVNGFKILGTVDELGAKVLQFFKIEFSIKR